jgi:hypothetical protein
MASVLIVQALQKGPRGSNQIAYTDVGSTDKLSEQGLDLRNIANKALPSWLLSKLKAHAINASSRPDAILFLPSTVCSSCVTTRNSNFQQLAKDKILNPNQLEVHLNEFKFCEHIRPEPQLQKAKAQHSVFRYCQPKQTKKREVKLYVILVGAMGTIYKDYTDKPLADLILDYHKMKRLTHKLNEHSIRHASALIKTRYALQYNYKTQATTVKVWVWVLRHTTPLTHINFFSCLHDGGLPGAGTYVAPSLNHAGCVITTSGVFFLFRSLFTLSLLHTSVSCFLYL